MGALLVAAGCDSEVQRVIEASKHLATQTPAPARPAARPASAPAGDAPVRLYLDASRSMSGFVGCGAGATQFDATLDRLANDLGIDAVTLFGEAPGTPRMEQRPLDASVHCPEAFTRTQNPDFELYRAMAADSVPAVHVYLTDGVQSALTSASPSPSVAALQRWIQDGRGLAVLAFRSRFSGPLWSEAVQRWLGEASTEQRPFYAFILAPSDAAVDAVMRKLSPTLLQNATELRFSGPEIVCRVERRVTPFQTETTDPVWALVPPPTGSVRGTGARPVAGMSCPIPPASPLAEIGATVQVEYRPWTGTDFAPPAPLPAGTQVRVDSIRAAPDSSTATVMAEFPPNAAARFGFYHVRLVPTPGRLKPVVEQLTADDDAAVSAADRSYRFGWLVEHLVRSRFGATVPERSFFLTIQNQ